MPVRKTVCSWGVLLGLVLAALTAPAAAAVKAPPPPQPKPDFAATSHAEALRLGGILSDHDIRTYRAAFKHFRAGKQDRALALAKQADNLTLVKVLRWMDMTRQGSRRDHNQVTAFIAANPHWPRQAALRTQAERMLPSGLRAQEVIDWFDGRPPLTAEGSIRLIRALKRALRPSEATVLARKVWVELDFTRSQEQAFRKEFKSLLRREDFVARLHRLLWDRRTAAAVRQAQRLGGGLEKLAQARIALYQRKGGVDAALARVPRELRNDPGLIFDRARWRQRKGRLDGVIELLDQDLSGASYPERWWRLRHWAARNALDEGRAKVAYRLSSQHGASSGLTFAEGEWLAGWIALRFLDRPEDAYRHFATLHDSVSSPISLSRAGYWAGEAAQTLGKTDWATRWYEVGAKHHTAFYGQLAAQRLNRNLPDDLPRAPKPTSFEVEQFEQQELVKIASLLGEFGENDLQGTFLHRLRLNAETPTEFVMVADLAVALGRHDHALRTAKLARKNGVLVPDHLFPELPNRLEDGPEAALVLALIRQESEFYRNAVSPAGARGLMQIMPATAKQVAKRTKQPYSKSRLTQDPAYNVALGRAYLASLIDRYSGSYVLALAAYNAGPGRANRWLREFGDPRSASVDTIDWIERIPFSETRNYVQRILESLAIYRLRQPNSAHTPVIRLARATP